MKEVLTIILIKTGDDEFTMIANGEVLREKVSQDEVMDASHFTIGDHFS